MWKCKSLAELGHNDIMQSHSKYIVSSVHATHSRGYKCVVNAYESIKHFRSISLFIYKVVKTVAGMQVFGRCSMSKSFSFIILKNERIIHFYYLKNVMNSLKNESITFFYYLKKWEKNTFLLSQKILFKKWEYNLFDYLKKQ